MKIYMSGNCQVSNIAVYLRQHPELQGDDTEINVFYCENCVHTMDLEKLMGCDVFIFQHMCARALKDICGHGSDMESFATSKILERLPDRVRRIAIPSIYCSVYWPNNFQRLPKEVLGRVPQRWLKYLPNYTFEADLLLAMLDGAQGGAFGLHARMLNHARYDRESVEFNVRNTLGELRKREEANAVSVRVSDFLEANYKKIRVLHTVNHPTREVFDHLVNGVLEVLGLAPDTTIMSQPDRMLTVQRPPIWPSTQRHLRLEFKDAGPYYAHGVKLRTVFEYLKFCLNPRLGL
jgi:Polysaccharide biosynthesis enzyme WcbI